MKAILAATVFLVVAGISSFPLFFAIYEPTPSGTIIRSLHLKIAGDPIGSLVILSERAGHDTALVDEMPRERVLSLYRFSYPFWHRVDEQSGTTHKLFADTTWGGSKLFSGSYVGYKISLLGAGALSSPDDDLVVKTREVALSGQWATSYVIVGLRNNKLKRFATVDGLWDVDAYITSPDAEGKVSLHLHGVERPTNAPFVRLNPKVDADVYFDGVHWVTRSPGGPTFGLYEN